MMASLKGPEVRCSLPRARQINSNCGGTAPTACCAGAANYKDEMSGEGARKAIRCAQIGHCDRLQPNEASERASALTVPSFAAAANECNDSFALSSALRTRSRAFHGRQSRGGRPISRCLRSALADSINKFSIPFMPRRFGELNSRRSQLPTPFPGPLHFLSSSSASTRPSLMRSHDLMS